MNEVKLTLQCASVPGDWIEIKEGTFGSGLFMEIFQNKWSSEIAFSYSSISELYEFLGDWLSENAYGGE